MAHRTIGTLVLLVVMPLLVAWSQASPPWPEPEYADYLDEMAQVFGLERLRAGSGLPVGHREIRIWIGFGLYQPETFAQIETDGHEVRGRRILWWSTATDSAEQAVFERDPHRSSNAELYASLRQAFGCGALCRNGAHEMCTVTLVGGQSWAALLAALDSLGVTTLPGGTTMGLDGEGIVVEAREGASYHTYSYSLPLSTAAQPDVRNAAAIADIIKGIGRRE